MNDRITIADLFESKRQGRKIAVVACYDFLTARLCQQAGVEMIIVGDSAAQMVLGHESTLPATMDFMVEITAGVRRGAENVLIVADMPFLSYQASTAQAVLNAGRFFTQAGAQIVKIEVTAAQLDVIKAVSDAGMAVMAHIGLKPQSISKTGIYKAEATTAEMGVELVNLADRCIEAGASTLLIEASACEVAEIICKRVSVPVISCGAGQACDGQVLIAPDILGMHQGKMAKFAKKYADLNKTVLNAFESYVKEIEEGKYPDDAHSYHMKKGEIERLKNILE